MSFYKAYFFIFLKIRLYKMTSISTPRHQISISKNDLESRHPHNFFMFSQVCDEITRSQQNRDVNACVICRESLHQHRSEEQVSVEGHMTQMGCSHWSSCGSKLLKPEQWFWQQFPIFRNFLIPHCLLRTHRGHTWMACGKLFKFLSFRTVFSQKCQKIK